MASAKKDCDDAALSRFDLERRIESLQQEIEFLKKIHEEEVTELQGRLQTTEIKIDMTPGPDLEALLDDMRKQYELMAAKNKAQAEQYFTQKVEIKFKFSFASDLLYFLQQTWKFINCVAQRCACSNHNYSLALSICGTFSWPLFLPFQVASIQEAASKNDDAVRNMRNEMSEYRKSVQTLNLEIDSLRGANDALNRGMGDLEDRYNRDCADYQETIANMTVSLLQYLHIYFLFDFKCWLNPTNSSLFDHL